MTHPVELTRGDVFEITEETSADLPERSRGGIDAGTQVSGGAGNTVSQRS